MRLPLLVLLIGLHSIPAGAQEFRVRSITSGTGFFVDFRGHLITSAHVVQHCKYITVRGAVEQQTAELVAEDTATDLALLRITAMPPAVATLRDSSIRLPKGEHAVIIGYPGEHALSGEYVVNEAKVTEPDIYSEGRRYVRFDNVADSGNSGGPLIDSSGHVIGVVANREVTTRRNPLAARDETLRVSSMAVALPVLQEFLASKGIAPYIAPSATYLSAGSIENDARHYILNIHCELE